MTDVFFYIVTAEVVYEQLLVTRISCCLYT